MAPLVVGVAGGTASGKSTLARAAATALGARVLTHDRYYLNAPNPRGHDFDRPEALETSLLAEHLAALRRGEAVEVPVYDFAHHRRADHTERIEPGDVLVVEGILVLAEPTLASQLDLAVYVECADDIRLARRIRRDIRERGREWQSVLDQWFATVRPAHMRHLPGSRARADLFLNGEGDLREETDRLVSAIRGATQSRGR
jgi:uridine kinase